MAEANKDAVAVEIKASIKKATDEIENFGKELQKAQRQMTLMISKLKSVGQIIQKITGYTDDYITALRLMNMTFDGSADAASKFVKNMSEMTGLDEATLTKQISLFKQLGDSFNMSDEYSTKFAESLTDLSAKLAILYNKDYQTMATTLQRAIQGTQTTLKSMTGIEVTDAAQQFILTSNGINKTVSSLNDAENHLNREELQKIGECVTRYSDSLKLNMMYLAKVDDGYYIRLSLPIQSLMRGCIA